MKYLIVNADDFGLSKGINEGIIKAYREGILTSTTLMVNMPAFNQAVSLAKENVGLGVGVHLNILRGYPVSPAEKVRSLIDEKGRFLSNPSAIIRKIAFGKINLDEVELEFTAQINKAVGSGLFITHVDSEKHMHMFYPILKRTIKVCKKIGINRLRVVKEICCPFRVSLFMKSAIVSGSGCLLADRLKKNGLYFPDNFAGLCNGGKMDARRLRNILFKLSEGITEVMVHPGFISEDMINLKKFGSYYINECREKELTALLDDELKKVVESQNIKLVNFGQINPRENKGVNWKK